MQLSLFDDTDYEEIIIPKGVESPLESNKGLTSNAFKKVQETFSNYVHAIQGYHGCSFLEARKLFYAYRDSQEPIKISKNVI